jgi:hypothetical protein
MRTVGQRTRKMGASYLVRLRVPSTSGYLAMGTSRRMSTVNGLISKPVQFPVMTASKLCCVNAFNVGRVIPPIQSYEPILSRIFVKVCFLIRGDRCPSSVKEKSPFSPRSDVFS